MNDLVVGIDLGTTNSEIAAYVDGRVRVLGPEDGKMLPSCVGISPNGELLVGESARNRQLIYPDRTVRSVKRKMGSMESVGLGEPVKRAVITVPAYFSDAQRNATREAGMMAGLEVVHILNEPTAASLAYGFGDGMRRTVMIYDLGGGTFDVSIVTVEGDVTEVLASHGNNRLGGDDFDDLLVQHLEREFHQQHGVWLRERYPAAYARLWWAAEAAKKKLSFEPHATVREESLVVHDGKPLHIDVELSRDEYEKMIQPLVESTLDSVSKALDDAGKTTSDLATILMVGGSTRTPLVSRLLQERTGLEPRQDVHPDLCVALGAGVLASRLAGHDVERVLVDVSPYSFGPAYLGERGGLPYSYCYHPIIRRNTPLPVTRTDSYYTTHPNQTAVEIQIFQGDDEDALKNLLVGDFRVDKLTPMRSGDLNEVLCRMSLDLDGILHVTAIEKHTGKSKQVTIANALQSKSEAEIAAARKRIEELYAMREVDTREVDMDEEAPETESEEFLDAEEVDFAAEDDLAGEQEIGANGDGEHQHVNGASVSVDATWSETRRLAVETLQRSRQALGSMHEEDQQEARELQQAIEAAVARHDGRALGEAVKTLKELLFFVEGS
jgi:molecular chaperone DnaK